MKNLLRFIAYVVGLVLLFGGVVVMIEDSLMYGSLLILCGLMCFKTIGRKVSNANKSVRVVENIEKYLGKNAVEYTMRNQRSDEMRAMGVIAGISYDPLEYLKQEEMETLRGHTVKYWATMVDSLVRDAHVDAEGQIQFFDEPFEVMGEKLMFPGDTSLGASEANTLGCRCFVVYKTIE